MNRIDYFNTIAGQIYLYNKRKYRRILISVDCVPKSKHSITVVEEQYFQNAVMHYLKENQRRAFNSSIVLKLDFYSFQDNPPAIHTLAKCYLDLLETNKYTGSRDRKKLIYKNDRQVKALFINYHISPNKRNKIHIEAYPLRDLKNDIELLEKIKNNDFTRSEYRHYRYNEEYEYSIANEMEYDDAINELIEFIKRKSSFVSIAGEETYSAWLDLYIQKAQKQFLRSSDFNFEQFLSLLNDVEWLTDEPLPISIVNDLLKDLAVNPFFSINLGEIPRIEGDTKRFKERVRSILENLNNGYYRLLFPLNTQLSVTIILFNNSDSSIDLDNLARIIVPYINEVLKPPSAFLSRTKVERMKDGEIKDKLIEMINELPKLPQYSITKYQIFEIPNMKTIPDGTVYLYLGDGSSGDNFKNKLDKIITNWINNVERY